jgi:hypothetical protein
MPKASALTSFNIGYRLMDGIEAIMRGTLDPAKCWTPALGNVETGIVQLPSRAAQLTLVYEFSVTLRQRYEELLNMARTSRAFWAMFNEAGVWQAVHRVVHAMAYFGNKPHAVPNSWPFNRNLGAHLPVEWYRLALSSMFRPTESVRKNRFYVPVRRILYGRGVNVTTHPVQHQPGLLPLQADEELSESSDDDGEEEDNDRRPPLPLSPFDIDDDHEDDGRGSGFVYLKSPKTQHKLVVPLSQTVSVALIDDKTLSPLDHRRLAREGRIWFGYIKGRSPTPKDAVEQFKAWRASEVDWHKRGPQRLRQLQKEAVAQLKKSTIAPPGEKKTKKRKRPVTENARDDALPTTPHVRKKMKHD